MNKIFKSLSSLLILICLVLLSSQNLWAENSFTKAFKYEKNYKEGTYGWIEISSFPSGAVVYLNNKRQHSLTPNKFKTPVGTYKVAVVIRGKASREIKGVKVKAGQTTPLETVDFRTEITRPNTRNLLD